MKKVVSGRWSALSWRKLVLCCLLLTAYCLLSCSVPNLEEPECTEARVAVKEFYSFHFGNDMQPTAENLKQRERFLTSELIKDLSEANAGKDPFTLTDDFPKAFRVGGCKVVESQRHVSFGVLLFWRTDDRNEQREISLEAVRENGRWLVNKISE